MLKTVLDVTLEGWRAFGRCLSNPPQLKSMLVRPTHPMCTPVLCRSEPVYGHESTIILINEAFKNPRGLYRSYGLGSREMRTSAKSRPRPNRK